MLQVHIWTRVTYVQALSCIMWNLLGRKERLEGEEERRGDDKRGEKRGGRLKKHRDKTEIPSPAAYGTSVGDVRASVHVCERTNAQTITHLCKFLSHCAEDEMIDAVGCFPVLHGSVRGCKWDQLNNRSVRSPSNAGCFGQHYMTDLASDTKAGQDKPSISI